MDSSNGISVVVLVVVIKLIVQGHCDSVISLDKVPHPTPGTSESIIHDLLQQYAESATEEPNFGTDAASDLGLVHDGQFEDNSKSTVEGIREAIRRRFDLYISQVKEVHGLDEGEEDAGQRAYHEPKSRASRSKRNRRAVIAADTVLPGRRRRNITEQHDTGNQVVRVVYPLNPQPFTYQKLSDLNTIQSKGDAYLFGLEVTDSGTYTCIYSIGKDLRPRELTRELTPGATKVEVWQIDSQIYVLPVEYNETSTDHIDAGSNLFRFDSSSRKLLKQQTIDTNYVNAIHFWTGTGEEANDVYLAVAPEFDVKSKKRSYEVAVSIYRWQSGYFDYVYSLSAYNPQSIRHSGILSRGYLGIANYQDDSGSTSIYSEIFRYNHKESKYVSFQKIRTQGAKSIEFFDFTTGEHEDHFLAIANHCEADRRGKCNYYQKSHIFKFGLDRFIPFQSFQTYGAFQFLSVKMESKSFLVLGEISGIRIFQYNGWKFTETYKLNLDYEALNPSLINLRSLIHGSEPYFTIASSETNIEGGVYALEFQQKNDYNNMAAEFEGECRKALVRVEAEDMPRLLQEVELAPKVTDQEIILESTIEFTNSTRMKNLYAATLSFSDISFGADTSIQLAKRIREYEYYRDDLGRLRLEAEGVMRRNQDSSIYAQVQFENVEYEGDILKAGNVLAERLNGQRLPDVLSKLVHLDKDYSFGTLEIDTLVTDQHIEVERLNDEDISDFALKSSQTTQTFRENNKFSGSVKIGSDLVVDGRFDDVDLKTIDFLLKTGNQTFSCDINVRESFVANLVAETVNGVELGYFLNEGVHRKEPARISGGKHFENLYVTSLDVLNGISGVDISELYAKAILAAGRAHQTFTGKETAFEFLSVKNMDLVNPKINDKWNLNDFVSISTGYYELDSVEFLEDTHVGHLKVNKSINKIRVADDGQLDIILKDFAKVQKIGNKVIEVLHLKKDSEAHGLVDSVNLTNWTHEKHIQLKQNRLRIGTFAPRGTLRIDEGIFVEKYGRFLFEGEDVMRHLQNALLLTATELPYTFRGTVSFDEVKVLGDSELRMINRLSTSDWLTTSVASSETLSIRGQKTFTGKVTFLNSISAAGLYHTYIGNSRSFYGQNEEVLSQLEDILIDGRNQTIQRNSIFESVLVVDKLICPAGSLLLQGIPFQNLLLSSLEQSVEGTVKFVKPLRVTKSFTVNGNLDTVKLNGYDLEALLKDTLMTHSATAQVFKAGAKFDNSLTVWNIQADDVVGGYNISLLLSNIIRKDIPTLQVIHGSLTFLEEAHLTNGLVFTGTLNGIGHEEWGHGYLVKGSRESQVLHTPLRFDASLTVKNLTVANGKVSNYNVPLLAKEILRVDQRGSLGTVYFTNTLIAEADSKRVNGINIVENVLLTTGKNPQVVTGTKTFSNRLEIDGSMNLERIAGIDYNQAVKFAYGKTAPTDHLKIEGNLVLRREPFFDTHFNGQEWNDLLNGIWWTDEPRTIQDTYTFDTMTLEGGADIEGLFSGIDLHDLERNYLSRSKDQRISGNYWFDNDLEFEGLQVDHVLIENGKINGLNLNEFRTSVFLHDVDQRIDFPVRFDELTVANLKLSEGALIGGIDLNKDAMLVNGPNVFQREVTVEELNAESVLLGNETLINGIHLGEWLEDSLLGNQAAEISGSLEFTQARFTQNIQVSGRVDGITFSEDNILTLSGDQTMRGVTTFTNKVIANDIYVKSGMVNGYHIQNLVDSLILKDRGSGSIVVAGEKTFLQHVKADSVIIESLFQGYDINDTLSNLKPEAYLSSYFNESLEERYKDMANLALDLHQVADRRGVFLEYFEVSNRFELKAELGSVNDIQILSYGQGPTLIISSFKKQELIQILSWVKYSSPLQTLNEIRFKGIVRGFVEIEREGQVFLVVALSSPDGLRSAEALLESKLTRSGYGELEKSSGKLGRSLILKLQPAGSWAVHQVLYANDFGSVDSFQLYLSNGHIRHCAVSLALDSVTGGRAVVLCFSPIPPEVSTKYGSDSDRGMEIYQALPVVPVPSSASLLGSLSTLAKTFLVFSTGDKGSEVVDVWTHGPSERKFVKESCIPAVLIRSLALTETAGGQVLLAVATVVVADENQQNGRVYIYRYSEAYRKFEKVQSLHLRNVETIEFQSFDLISRATELLYVQTKTSIYVYAYKGFAGFALEHVLPAPDSHLMETTANVIDGTFRAEVLVTIGMEVQVYRAKLAGAASEQHESSLGTGEDLVSYD